MKAALEQANEILEGQLEVPMHSARAAAWVGRSQLEHTVAELLRAQGIDPGEATMRTRLTCLQVVYEDADPTVAADVQYAWDCLSQAAHYHAYELAPSHTEIKRLLQVVSRLAERSLTPPINPPPAVH